MRFVTYSPAYTLVPTYECFNRCHYCNFRTDPGKDDWLDLETARNILIPLKAAGICEILILSGEVHPRSPRRAAWLQHIADLCELALSLSFLPHTNVGPLSRAEMARLKPVNVSMGLMLEQVTPRLLETVHRHAPSKLPALRSQQLEQAGELGIPFTTGILLGIGETLDDCWYTLDAIAQSHQRWGHLQEVILQPYSPGTQESWQAPGFDLAQLPTIVARAREILPDAIALQIPPNLVSDATPESDNLLFACLAAGASDLGGIGPRDEVNPDYPHPASQQLAERLAVGGWQLQPRLPVYPQYDGWLPMSLQSAVTHWRQTLVGEIEAI